MASPAQLQWLASTYQSALRAATAYSPWTLGITPQQYAGCAAAEAAVETGWGAHLPPSSDNVLGIKAYDGWNGPVVGADGTEQARDGSWSGPQLDKWCVFATTDDCFAQQLRILQEARYAGARAAQGPLTYIALECAVWSTGQAKGEIVTQIYQAHASGLE
jgi:hypothetical protein